MTRDSQASDGAHETEGYGLTDDGAVELSRRSAMAGMGGLFGASLVSAGAAGTAAADVEVDVHTRQTYRAIVDAAIPRTPDLGPELETGALDIDLEEFVIFQLEFGQTVPPKFLQPEGLEDQWEQHWSSEDDDLEQYLAGLEQQVGFSLEEDLGLSREAVFGALEGFRVELTGGGNTLLAVTTTDGDTEVELQDELPLATLFAATLDLYALFLVLGGGTRGPIRPREKFRGGGLFTFLAPVDRIQCLLFIASDDGQDIDAAGGAFLPEPLVAKKLVGSTMVSYLIGFYTEWHIYGSTKTADPNDREVQRDFSEVPGWQQIGYDGPVKGRAGWVDGPVDEFVENDWGDGA